MPKPVNNSSLLIFLMAVSTARPALHLRNGMTRATPENTKHQVPICTITGTLVAIRNFLKRVSAFLMVTNVVIGVGTTFTANGVIANRATATSSCGQPLRTPSAPAQATEASNMKLPSPKSTLRAWSPASSTNRPTETAAPRVSISLLKQTRRHLETWP